MSSGCSIGVGQPRSQDVRQPVRPAVLAAVQPTVPAVSAQLLPDVQLQPTAAAASDVQHPAAGAHSFDVHQHQRAARSTAAPDAGHRAQRLEPVDGKRTYPCSPPPSTAVNRVCLC